MKFLKELYDMEHSSAAPSHLAMDDGTDAPISQKPQGYNPQEDDQDEEEHTDHEDDSVTIDISALARLFSWVKHEENSEEEIHQLLTKIIDHKDHPITLDDFNSLVGEDDHEDSDHGEDDADSHMGHHLQDFDSHNAPAIKPAPRGMPSALHDEY